MYTDRHKIRIGTIGTIEPSSVFVYRYPPANTNSDMSSSIIQAKWYPRMNIVFTYCDDFSVCMF